MTCCFEMVFVAVSRAIEMLTPVLALLLAAAPLVDAVKSGDKAAALALIERRADVNAPEADGTTALHWAVHQNDLDLAARLLRAGAKVNAKNDYGATPMSEAADHRQRGDDRGAAEGRRRCRVAEPRRSDGADGHRAHRPRRCGPGPAAPRRQRQRGRTMARTDRVDVGDRPEPGRDGEGARCRRRRRERAIDGQQLAAAGHRRAARDLPARRRADAALVRRPRRLRRVREVPGGRRRQPQPRRSGRGQPAAAVDPQWALRPRRVSDPEGRESRASGTGTAARRSTPRWT